MFQYHYLGPDDWVDAARKQTKFQDGPKLCICVLGATTDREYR